MTLHNADARLLIPDGEPEEEALFHSRVSFRWGYELIKAARRVRAGLPTGFPKVPVLITQGLRDQICPARFLHEMLGDSDLPHVRLREFPDALHEPFGDDDHDALLDELLNWLDQEVLGTTAA